ncbi:thymidylate synthase [Brevipalpus obovatus]|uniref:thymidylate synthase n=1 Tax=Brevipalpus obovatus TaxID=246614 RepID=UPI003D9F61AD
MKSTGLLDHAGYQAVCQAVLRKGAKRDNNLSSFGHLNRYTLRNGKLPVWCCSDVKSVYNQLVETITGEKSVEFGFAQQLEKVVESLRKNPNDRRIIACRWKVSTPEAKSVKPVDCLAQFYVKDEKELSCMMFQRSANVIDDIPLQVTKYSLLTHILANMCDLIASEFIHAIGIAHMSSNQADDLQNKPNDGPSKPYPKLVIKHKIDSLYTIDFENFQIIDELENGTSLSQQQNNHQDKEMAISDGGESTSLSSDEQKYLDTCQLILKGGAIKNDRTKTGTLSVFGVMDRYSLRNDCLPVLTTKRVFYRGVLEELIWFIKGCTDASVLSNKGVKIWDEHGSRKFLQSIGIMDREEGDLGPVYGFQWRHYGADYKDKNTDYTGKGVDQLAQLVGSLKENPHADDHILCAWNVADLPRMALPPCHCFAQFYVTAGELSCLMYQRSGDMGLGVPFNIASYSLLTHILANMVGLKPGEFVHIIGDAHIYSDHVEPIKEQLKREPRSFPKLRIKKAINSLDELDSDNFELINYKPHPKIAMEMAV